METPIANAEDFIPTGEYNPYNVRPWVINNEYGYLCFVYAAHAQDAFDIAADNDCLKGLAIDSEDAIALHEEYGDDAPVMFLGNAGDPFDSEHAGLSELKRNYSPAELAAIEPDDIKTTVLTRPLY